MQFFEILIVKVRNMMENVLDIFSNNLFTFLTGKNKSARGLLVKKHSENLQTHGEFSFPNTVKSWHEYVPSDRLVSHEDENMLKCVDKSVDDLVCESKKWTLPINIAKEEKGRVYIFLERQNAIRVGLTQAMRNNSLISQRILEGSPFVQIDPLCDDQNSITSLRLKYLSKSIQNLYAINSTCQKVSVLVTSKSSSKSNEAKTVLCGTVLNAKTGAKETSLNSGDFIRLRQNDMTLIAQHKYGVRVATDSKWQEFISHLGESAVIFELLQTKPSSAVKINFECCSAGSSKGAAFILYNCARLETMIRTFKDKVDEGTYPALPDFEQVDFSLLTQEDEWCLVFNYILGLPSLLENCVEINNRMCEFRPHLICSFLCSMVRVFSQYYRKTRILTEPRKHLLPVMFARLHLITILNDTLKICLTILNIKSVSQM